MICVAIFSEGNFDRITDPTEHPTIDEARSFACGVQEGAGLYGAGDCRAYVLPEDENELRGDTLNLRPAAADRALSAWQAVQATDAAALRSPHATDTEEKR